MGSMGTSWAERKVPHPKKLSRPSLSGLFSSIDATDVPSGSIRNNPMFDEDEAGELPPFTSSLAVSTTCYILNCSTGISVSCVI